MESITSQEIEDNNEDSNANQKILKLKKENDRLKLIENKYKDLEKEKEKYQKENSELKKELEFIRLKKNDLNNNKNGKEFSIIDTNRSESFEIKGINNINKIQNLQQNIDNNDEEEFEEYVFNNEDGNENKKLLLVSSYILIF